MKETRICKLRSIRFESENSTDIYFRGAKINKKNINTVSNVLLITDNGEEIEVKGNFLENKILKELVNNTNSLVNLTLEIKEENLI